MKRSRTSQLLLFALIITSLPLALAQSHQHDHGSPRKPPPFDRPAKSAESTFESKTETKADTKAVSKTDAKTEAKNAGDDSRIRLGVDLVVVDALVLQQKTGRVVGGLNKDDFKIFEDGVQQKITHFSQDTLPLSVILLVDRGGCLDPFGNEVRRATTEALSRLRPQDEVAMMAFHDDVTLMQGFTRDRRAIEDAVRAMPGHEEEKPHCFSHAFYEAARYMNRAANPDGRRVIIMITAITRDIECPGGPSAEDARVAVLESGSVVCGLIPKSAGQAFENGVLNTVAGIAGIFRVKTWSLKKLVEETGGEIVSDSPERLDGVFTTLIDHLRTRYSIGFVSSNTKRDGAYRKLKLEVAGPSDKDDRRVVRARRGYFAAKGEPKT